jgi:hypothetical protein
MGIISRQSIRDSLLFSFPFLGSLIFQARLAPRSAFLRFKIRVGGHPRQKGQIDLLEERAEK